MSRSWIGRGAASAERMRRQLARNGFTPNGHPLWDRPETASLVDGHPDYSTIMPLILRRTRPAAYAKAGRLKITRPRSPRWSDNEIMRLRKVYPRGTRGEILLAFPQRSYAAIAKAANARGIYRAPKPVRPTGNTVLDQILRRCREQNVALDDLDRWTRSKGYFHKRRWQAGRYNFTAHRAAAILLGGVFRFRVLERE